MTTIENTTNISTGSWFNSTRLGIIALIINILSILYLGIISNQDLKSLVKSHDASIKSIEIKLDGIERTKVSNEVFNMLLITITDIKTGQTEMRTMLNAHINK